MKTGYLSHLGLLCATLGFSACESANESTEVPNIIFILADDLGYMDVGAFASHVTGASTDEMFYETPNINRLVNEGQAFTSAYVCPLSSPTRSELLTGKYAATIGFTSALPYRDTWYMTAQTPPDGAYIHDAVHHADPIKIEQAWNNGKSNTAIPAGLPVDNGRKCVVLPEAMEGYYSAFVGKWHVGGMGADGYQPADRGFDEVLAYRDAGSSPHFNWRNSWDDKSKKRFPDMPQKEWTVGKAGKETGEKYLTDDLTVRALDFIDRMVKSKEKKPFLLYFSHFAVHTPIQSKKEYIDYFDKKATKGWNGHQDPVYAGLLKSLDDSVGKILDKLDECGIADNTLVVFMSDNGGIEGKITPKGFFTDNSPYIGGKATVYEGGIKTPLAMRWKGHIKPGQWCDVTVDACDIFPTLLEVGGIDPTPYYDVNKIDGRSIWPLTTDINNQSGKYPRDTFMFHYPFNVIYNDPVDGYNLTPHSAIRCGDMKLIFDWHGRLYLFDMKNDPYEKKNLSATYPDVTNKMFAQLMNWLESNVQKQYWPTVNTSYNPDKEVRKSAPFVNLIDVYRNGGDVAQAAIKPDMSEIVIP